MALAKYYEDIIERLHEDRESILAKFKASDFRRLSDKNEDLIRHIERHLEASAKALNTMLEVITNPDNQAPMTMVEAKAAIAKNKVLDEHLSACRAELAKTASELRSVVAQRDKLKNCTETQERDIRTMKQTEKELRRQVKNSASKRR